MPIYPTVTPVPLWGPKNMILKRPLLQTVVQGCNMHFTTAIISIPGTQSKATMAAWHQPNILGTKTQLIYTMRLQRKGSTACSLFVPALDILALLNKMNPRWKICPRMPNAKVVDNPSGGAALIMESVKMRSLGRHSALLGQQLARCPNLPSTADFSAMKKCVQLIDVSRDFLHFLFC